MIKTLDRAQKSDRVKFKIPKSVQDTIPIQRIWPDGIFQVGEKFSKTWAFTDINYSVASKEDKTAMFLDYADFLNALDSGISAKITVNNRRANQVESARQLLAPPQRDGMDKYRNVDELLRSDTAKQMLANSEFLVMLNQAATDREELAKLLHISENQLGYITNSPAGSGLIKCGGSIVPFENPIPKNTQLYKLITTKPGEATLH